MLSFEGTVKAGERVILKYDPDQPRDGEGQWSETGAGGFGGLNIGGKPARVSQDALRRALEMGGNFVAPSEEYTDLTDRTGEQLVEVFSPETGKLNSGQKDALQGYVSGDATPINSKLRTGENLSPSEAAMVKSLDSAIGKSSLPQDVVLYRGIRYGGSRYEKVIADIQSGKLKPGTVISDTGFSSTTLDRNIADKNFSKGGVIFKINGRKGSKGIYVDAGLGGGSDYANEQEFLLPRNSQFKITKVTKKGSGYIVEGEYAN